MQQNAGSISLEHFCTVLNEIETKLFLLHDDDDQTNAILVMVRELNLAIFSLFPGSKTKHITLGNHSQTIQQSNGAVSIESIFVRCVILLDSVCCKNKNSGPIPSLTSALCQTLSLLLQNDYESEQFVLNNVITMHTVMNLLIRAVQHSWKFIHVFDEVGGWSCFEPVTDLTILLIQYIRGVTQAQNEYITQLLTAVCNCLELNLMELNESSTLLMNLVQTLDNCISVSSACRALVYHEKTNAIELMYKLLLESDPVDPNLFQMVWHSVLLVLTERIGCEPPKPFTCDSIIQILKKCIHPTSQIRIKQELLLESLQFLYMSSQSLMYQEALSSYSKEIATICLLWLHTSNATQHFIIQYFILKMLREWMDESFDHLIVTASVSKIVAAMLEPEQNDSSVSRLAVRIIPLCGQGSSLSNHERVCKAAIELISFMAAQLSSTTRDMHYLANHLQLYMITPLVNRNDTIMHAIDHQEEVYVSIVKHLLAQNRLVPALIDSGIIMAIEGSKNLQRELAPMLNTLRAIELESKTITARYSIQTFRQTDLASFLQSLDKGQLEYKEQQDDIGPGIARWDMKTQRRIMFNPLLESVITFARPSPVDSNLIVACSYDGEIACFDREWNAVSEILNLSCEKLTHASYSLDGTSLVVTCEGSDVTNGSLIAVISILKDGERYKLELVSKCIDSYIYADFVGNNDQYLFVTSQVKTLTHNGVKIQLLEKKNHDERAISTSNSHDNSKNSVISYDLKYERVLNERGPSISIVQTNEDNSLIALGFTDRKVKIIDMKSLEEIIEFQCPGSSSIRCMIFENDCIYTKSQARTLDLWKLDRASGTAEMAKSFKTAFSTVYMFCWANREKSKLWFMTDHSLHHYDMELQNDTYVSFHSLTCCGLDFSPDGKYLLSGDFAGNVFLWSLDSNLATTYEMYQQTNVFMSVRALKCKWSRTGESENREWLDVFIGTLDGNVHCWKVNLVDPSKTTDSERIFALQDSITCIEFQHGDDPSLLAVGTSDGMLCVMERPRPGEGSLMRIKLAIVAHRPITDNTDLRFGSINKFSEVWSISWSPCNNFVVTASEDQTCAIWNLYGEKMHSLTGHTTAVTAVEWRKIPSLGEVLITVADDRKVMIWRLNTPQNIHYHHHQQIASHRPDSVDGGPESRIIDKKNKWGLYHVFTTEGYGLDWHTLTYMCVERCHNDRIAVATQNGYLFVWDISTKQLISRYKRHYGSIEGMAWSEDVNRNYLATCGSDCTINLYSMSLQR